MNRIYFIQFIAFIIIFSSCQRKQKVDYIIKDTVIYTMNKNNEVAQCMAVSNGKIVSIGTNEDVLNDYDSDSIVSLKNQFIYPAFIDAHAHFFGLANYLGECNLIGAKSVEEIIQRLKIFYQKHPDKKWIIGRGWDQNLFPDKTFPSKESLDSVFSNIPVCLTRIDGHAIWTNSKAIDIAGITNTTTIQGGAILKNKKGEPTGIFIDNATTLVEKHITPLSRKEIIQLLMKADSICQKNNLHWIYDAGLEYWQIQLLDSLIDKKLIRTKIYAMALPTKENIEYFTHHKYIDKEHFKVKAFKIYADGALGSRGALLKQPYNDIDKNNAHPYGLLLIQPDSLKKILQFCYAHQLQVCTHAIGDSANKFILQMYAQYLSDNNNKRWRIEHAQVVDTADLWYFKEYQIIPSVQPTHAISDKNWATERLGQNRIHFAYAYQNLWQQNQMLALGTDFPVEDVSPLKTFYAAVFRTDYDNKDTSVFQKEQCLTRIQCLRGMTIDAAYSAFLENDYGSLEKGKYADFIVLDIDLMNISQEQLSQYITNHH